MLISYRTEPGGNLWLGTFMKSSQRVAKYTTVLLPVLRKTGDGSSTSVSSSSEQFLG